MLDAFVVTFTAPTFDKKGRLTQKGTVTINDGFDYGVKIEKVPQVKPGASPQAPGNAQSNRASLNYQASSHDLTFVNEIMTGTGFVGDPVSGAPINVPLLALTGRSEGRFVFESDGSTPFTIGTYLSAQLPAAYYVRSENLFYGELTDFSFSSQGSPWIAELASLFDANSPDFDPNLALWVTISPNQSLFSVTGGFLLDGVVGDVKQIFAADAVPVPPPVPEPGSAWPLMSGAMALLLLPRRRRFLG
jgi:hypothetical protein